MSLPSYLPSCEQQNFYDFHARVYTDRVDYSSLKNVVRLYRKRDLKGRFMQRAFITRAGIHLNLNVKDVTDFKVDY